VTKLLAFSALSILEPTPGFKMISFLTVFASRKMLFLLFPPHEAVIDVLLPVSRFPASPFFSFSFLIISENVLSPTLILVNCY
jgi:hypothetical protein